MTINDQHEITPLNMVPWGEDGKTTIVYRGNSYEEDTKVIIIIDYILKPSTEYDPTFSTVDNNQTIVNNGNYL